MAESSSEAVDAVKVGNLTEDLKYSDENCDFIIKVRGVSYPVRQTILISNSDYFRGMLTHDTKEQQDGFVEIKEIDSQTMKLCIDFMYDCDIDVTMETAKTLLPAAEFLQLTELSKRCVEVLESNIKSGNCITVLKLARAYYCYELAEKALDIFKREFKMENHEDFCKLDKQGIKQHINDLDMEIAWDGIINWIKLDVENRSSDIVELVKMLKWKSFPSSEFLYSVWMEPLFKCSESCCNWMFRNLLLNNKILEKEVNVENCLIVEKIALASPLLSEDTKEVIFDFMRNNFAVVAKKPEFKSLSRESILDVFSSNEVGLCDETLRWAVMIKWMRNNPGQKRCFPELLRCIQFHQLPKNFIESVVLEEPLLLEIPFWNNRFLHSLLNTSKDKSYVAVLYPDGAILAWDISDKSWLQHKLPNCPKTGKYIRMFSFRDKLCVLVDKELFYLGKNETKWISLAVMNHCPGRDSSIVFTDDKIYIVERNRMSSYDPNSDIWNENLPGCGLDWKLFSGCTSDRIYVRNTSEHERCYFLREGKWNQTTGCEKPINENAAMASHNGKMFVVGLGEFHHGNNKNFVWGDMRSTRADVRKCVTVKCYSNGWKNICNTPGEIRSPSHLFFVDGQLFLLASKLLYLYVEIVDVWIKLGCVPQYGHRPKNESLDPVSVCSFKGNLENFHA